MKLTINEKIMQCVLGEWKKDQEIEYKPKEEQIKFLSKALVKYNYREHNINEAAENILNQIRYPY